MPPQKARSPTAVAVNRAPVGGLGETSDDSARTHSVKAITTVARASPLRLVIEPTVSGRKWTARLGDRVLCTSVWPFVKSARVLLAEGHPADTVIEIWRPNTDEWAMRGRLGAVAATVIDGEAGSRGAKNGPPARDLEKGRGKRGDRWLALVLGPFLGWAITPSNEANTLGGARRPRRGSDLNDVAKLSPAGGQASSRAAQLQEDADNGGGRNVAGADSDQ
jgi:hypothetical protein